MNQCHCGRAGRGFGYSNPDFRTPVVHTCSIACMGVLHARKGKVVKINSMERDAVRAVVRPNMDELRGFDYANCPPEDIYAFVEWLYGEVCLAVAEEYKKPVTADDVPF